MVCSVALCLSWRTPTHALEQSRQFKLQGLGINLVRQRQRRRAGPAPKHALRPARQRQTASYASLPLWCCTSSVFRCLSCVGKVSECEIPLNLVIIRSSESEGGGQARVDMPRKGRWVEDQRLSLISFCLRPPDALARHRQVPDHGPLSDVH